MVTSDYGAYVAAEARAVAAEQALGEIAYLVMTRRIGIHMNGEEQWPTPMHKQIADLARAALSRPPTVQEKA